VTQTEGAAVAGDIKGVDAELIALGAFLGPALLLFAIGLLLASVVAGLLLVGVGTRQLRATERVIATEPLNAFGTGLFAAIVIPILAIVAIVTIVGAPLGLGILLGALPLLAFAGFLVGGIFLGEELLGSRKEPAAARPYRGALLGIVLLQVIGLVPIVGGLATAVTSILGLGAILLLGWRTVRGTGAGQTSTPVSAPAPIAV
jgi:MFS family permease